MNKLFVFLLIAALAISAFAEEDCRDRLARREADAKDARQKTTDLLNAANTRATTLAGQLTEKKNKLAKDFPADLINTNREDIAGYIEEIQRHEERLKVLTTQSAIARTTRSLNEAKTSLAELQAEMKAFDALRAEIADIEAQIAGNNDVIAALKKQLNLIATMLADIAKLQVICAENCDKAQGDYLTALQKEAADLNAAIADRDAIKNKIATLTSQINGLVDQIAAQQANVNAKSDRCNVHKATGDQLSKKIANEIALCELLIEKTQSLNSKGDKDNIITILQGLIDKLKKTNPFAAWKDCLAELQELIKVRDSFNNAKTTATVSKNGAVAELAVAENVVATETLSVKQAQDALNAAQHKCNTIKMMQAQTESTTDSVQLLQEEAQTEDRDEERGNNGRRVGQQPQPEEGGDRVDAGIQSTEGAKVESFNDNSVAQSITDDVESLLNSVSNQEFTEVAQTEAVVESLKPATSINIEEYTVVPSQSQEQFDSATVESIQL